MDTPKLTENAWINGVGYGPGFGDRQPPADDGLVHHDLPPVPLLGEPGPVPEPATPVSELPADAEEFGWLIEGQEPAEPASPLVALAAVPDDKAALLEFAKAHDLDVDARKGAAKLRVDIEQALAAGTAAP